MKENAQDCERRSFARGQKKKIQIQIHLKMEERRNVAARSSKLKEILLMRFFLDENPEENGREKH